MCLGFDVGELSQVFDIEFNVRHRGAATGEDEAGGPFVFGERFFVFGGARDAIKNLRLACPAAARAAAVFEREALCSCGLEQGLLRRTMEDFGVGQCY